ncbi:CehA/McbA family metallohydrolase [bacterium]|nr:CehA/McbA family metallohydrolase [bacterium]
MIDPNIYDLIPLIGLYAETHYRFSLFPFSLYYRRQPEIIFDAPHRLEPGIPLPVTLIVKDAHHFPITINKVVIECSCEGYNVSEEIPLNMEIPPSSKIGRVQSPVLLWHRIFEINVSDLPSGNMTVKVTTHFSRNGRIHVVRQDNYFGLSHAPFKVFKAANPLPKMPGWEPGELHTHTEYGCDQVEFGAPLEAIVTNARAIGLGWTALTDHSYNLDDLEDDYLHDDPELKKWRRFLEHVKRLNRERGEVVLIPGEELTCRSSNGRNLHMLVLGEEIFLPGGGDSAQRWFHTRSELSVDEALSRISDTAFAAAAHPLNDTPLLERILVKRGRWQPSDLSASRLDGWQILNGNPDRGFRHGLNSWVSALLRGERKYIYAGNDSHGNFNRFRQVCLPMMKLHEHHNHLFGKSLTHVRTEGKHDVESIITALKSGRATVSNGPAIELNVVADQHTFHSGDALPPSVWGDVCIGYASTVEFGRIVHLKISTAGNNGEVCLLEIDDKDKQGLSDPYQGKVMLQLKGRSYIRAELTTRTDDGTENLAFSNPIWIDS